MIDQDVAVVVVVVVAVVVVVVVVVEVILKVDSLHPIPWILVD